jgi:hypothetical protein
MSTSELYDRSYEFGRILGARGGSPIRVAVAIDPRVAADPTAQLIAIAICNLLPRISERYVNVDLKIPDHVQVTVPRMGGGLLLRRLLGTLTAACLVGRFQEVDSSAAPHDYCFVVGEDCPVPSHNVIHVWSSGWRCFVSRHPLRILANVSRRLNPFAVLAAASLAVMVLYHNAEDLNEYLHSTEIAGWSLLDYSLGSDDGPPLPASIDVGKVVQAGLGGTANALLWCLRYGPELIGEWQSFEHEILDLPNGNRYLLVDVGDRRSKAQAVSERFGSFHHALNFQVTEGRFEEKCGGLLDSTLVLATIDDPQIRVALQRLGAEIILNVGTNTQWLSISRHELGSIREGAACVDCFYGSSEQAPRRIRESTVSFVIGLVGAMLGAEFVKSYCFPEHRLQNSWVANVFAPVAARTLLRPPTPNCESCAAIRS